MKTVAVETLRESLDLYLEMVKGGERVQITRGSDVIAELAKPDTDHLKAEREWLDQQVREGKLSSPSNPTGNIREILARRPRGPAIDAQAILNETRADRY